MFTEACYDGTFIVRDSVRCVGDTYLMGSYSCETPTYHFSIDDVIDPLVDAADRQLSLGAHPWFQFLDHLHAAYATRIHLYLFYATRLAGRLRTLAELPLDFRAALRDRDWLCFGPHAHDPDTPPHTQTPSAQRAVFEAIYQCILQWVPSTHLSPWVRLHYFSESYELADYFASRGVTALFSTDKPAISYRLPAEAQARLGQHGTVTYQGMRFIRSHGRIEQFVAQGYTPAQVQAVLASLLAQWRCAVVFTHAYELLRPEVQQMTWTVLHALHALGARSV